MNNPLDPSLRGLSDCGGCAGLEASTPARIVNRPGLSAVSFRSGTHAQFKASLLAALTSQDRSRLASLTTRADDDVTIALLDGFSAMADVLTFYAERIANECFLRTATERRSVLELARTIGYELKPGVAASTWLAFTVEETPGAPDHAEVALGTQVQSVPGPGEKPQTFEAVERLEARREWNDLRARATETETPWLGLRQLHLQGVATNLKPGDALLIVGAEREADSGNENWDFRRVQSVVPMPDPDPTKGFTVVTLDRPLGSFMPRVEPAKQQAKVYALRTRANLFGHSAPDWLAMPASLRQAYGEPTNAPQPQLPEWPRFTLAEVTGIPAAGTGTGLLGEYYNTADFRERRFARTDAQLNFDWGAGTPHPRVDSDTFSVRWTGWIQPRVTGDHTFFTLSDDGVRLWINEERVIDQWNLHAATEHTSRPIPLEAGRKYPVRVEYFEQTGLAVLKLLWAHPGQSKELVPTAQLFPGDERFLHLDAVYKDLVPGGWAVVSTPEYQEAYQILEASEEARTGFTLSAKCTRLKLRGERLLLEFNDRLRDASVFAQSEWLPWADAPIRRPVQGDRVELDRLISDLAPGRRLIVQGRAPGGRPQDPLRIEQATVKKTLTLNPARTTLELTSALTHAYDPATVRIAANVALATHGETVREILGHGNAAQPHQSFALKQQPLTFTPARTASGGESSLEVWVNDVRWQEAPSLYARDRRDRVFVARQQDNGSTVVTFGDGQSGARLPTGQENVRAVFRKGTGLAGLLKPGQLSLLMTRPLGLKAVTNPLASSGAEDPETIESARANAPMQVLTLGRVVSLEDYADFARAYSGVAKAHATWVWTQRGRAVYVTVVGPEGSSLPEDGPTVNGLKSALVEFGNPQIPVLVTVGAVTRFAVGGVVLVAPDRLPARVKSDLDTALVARFRFAARDFGQGIASSELHQVVRGVPGVVALRLTAFHTGTVPPSGPLPARLKARSPAAGAALEDAEPAEVLMLDASNLPNLVTQVL